MTDAEKIDNNCIWYEHLNGYPWPALRGSCKGCKYNIVPEGMDGGCKHPEGFLDRHKLNLYGGEMNEKD